MISGFLLLFSSTSLHNTQKRNKKTERENLRNEKTLIKRKRELDNNSIFEIHLYFGNL